MTTQTQAQHTPGPWIQGKGDELAIFSPSTSYCVANVHSTGRGLPGVAISKTALANARLIAAAPDLLEAVKSLTYNHVKGLCDCSGCKAIAKATNA